MLKHSIYFLLWINLYFIRNHFLIENFTSFSTVFWRHFPFKSYFVKCYHYKNFFQWPNYVIQSAMFWGENFMWYKYFSTCFKVRPIKFASKMLHICIIDAPNIHHFKRWTHTLFRGYLSCIKVLLFQIMLKMI